MTTTDVAEPALVAALSQLEACARLLGDAKDPTLPVARRLGLAVAFCQRLDEVFGSAGTDFLPFSARAHELVDAHDALVNDELLPTLAVGGVSVLDWTDLSDRERDSIRLFFEKQIHPVLTPITVDATHPFPYVSSLGSNLAVSLRDRETGHLRFARVDVPSHLPRLLALDDGRVLPIEAVIKAHLAVVFVGMSVLAAECFRVTRGPVDLVVDGRSYGPPTRLEVEATMRGRPLRLLMEELTIVRRDLYRVRNPAVMGETLRALSELIQPDFGRASGHRRGAA